MTQKRGRGRPGKGRSDRVTMCMTPELRALIEAMALRDNKDAGVWCRDLVIRHIRTECGDSTPET